MSNHTATVNVLTLVAGDRVILDGATTYVVERVGRGLKERAVTYRPAGGRSDDTFTITHPATASVEVPAPTATATLTRPAVAQIDYREDGRSVTATLEADGTTTLNLDAGTLATVLAVLRDAATEADANYRRAERAGDVRADHLPYLGNRASRPRLVVDAIEVARQRAGIAGVTYDLD